MRPGLLKEEAWGCSLLFSLLKSLGRIGVFFICLYALSRPCRVLAQRTASPLLPQGGAAGPDAGVCLRPTQADALCACSPATFPGLFPLLWGAHAGNCPQAAGLKGSCVPVRASRPSFPMESAACSAASMSFGRAPRAPAVSSQLLPVPPSCSFLGTRPG